MTDIEILQRFFGNKPAEELPAASWEAAMAEKPDGIPFFLEDAFILEQLHFLGTDEALDLIPPCLATAQWLRGDEAACKLMWHCYRTLFLAKEMIPLPGGWPELPELGDNKGMPYFLCGLAIIPMVRKNHSQWNVPDKITRDTCAQLIRYCNDNYRRGNKGRPGIYQNQLSWTRNYIKEPYFRIGRLEYWLKPSTVNLTVYRNKHTRQVIAFPAEKTRFAANGYRFSDDAEYETTESWTSEAEFQDGYLVATPYSALGYGVREKVRLPLDEWELYFTKGDFTFNMHIPSGGGMTPEACKESFLNARSFFKEHFPDSPVKVATCGSWIFNTQLQEIFPENANLVRFQRELYLYPSASGPWDGLWFIFLQSGKPDPETVPLNTTLQRKIYEYLQKGIRWRCGNMFMVMDDVEQFGTQLYRNQWLNKY